MIAGVCGGIADWGGWDPVLVRVAYVVITAFTGLFPGALSYVVLWIIIPEDTDFDE